MKSFVQRKLTVYAKKVLAREKPEIIGVTGSVGKSSAKQAIAAVLERKFAVRASPKNYNTEFGLPLSVLELPSARSPLQWLGTLKKAWSRATFGMENYPKLLVLEMAADKPGDIAVLCDIAPPRIGVVTAVAESHAEFFGSIDAITKEKRTLVERLPKDGIAILNRDDERVWAMRDRTKAARIVGYGFHPEADVRTVEGSITFSHEAESECGMHFKISAGGATVPVYLPGVLGRHAVYAALAAAAVGLAKGMNLVEISDRLRSFEPPPGRMRCLAGIKRTVVIDDSYNAAPASALAALTALAELPLGEDDKRFAVLGDMLELGALSKEGHEKVGIAAAGSGADHLIFVGERMGDADKAARAAGASGDRVFHFATPEEAGKFVQERMKKGDAVLVKGSRGMRMEKVVKEIMADPMAAERLLVSVDESSKW